MKMKERLLNTLQGLPTDELPYLPRLDIWYNANKFRGTLPEKYKNATLKELTEDLDVGYHYIIPDYKCWDGEGRDEDIGLAHYKFNTKPFRLEFHNVKREICVDANETTHIKYITPVGEVSTAYHYDQKMKASGLTLNVINEHAIKCDKDYNTVAYIFENCEVIPDYEKYEYFKNEVVGDNGLCIGYARVWGSPMHYICQDLMSFDMRCEEYFCNIEMMEELADRIEPFMHNIFEAALNSSAEVIMTAANYDGSAITPPNMFAKYITPYLKKDADACHAKGKFILNHTDGENRGLLEEYLKAGIDIADSICPQPMTSQTLKEVRDVFGDRITIWGGIPSAYLLDNTASDYEFEKFVDMTLESIGSGRKIIMGIADTTPPDARLERIMYIAKKCKEFGPIR